MTKWLTSFGVEERQLNLMQPIDANSTKEDVTDQISKVIGNILDNKQTEKESMREVFIMKIRHMIEKKQRETIADVTSGLDGDKSIDEADLNKTGELSKMSNKEDTARKSKDKTGGEPADPSVDQMNKSALSSALSSGNV